LTMEASESCPQGRLLSAGLDSKILVQEYQHTLRMEVLAKKARKSMMAQHLRKSASPLHDTPSSPEQAHLQGITAFYQQQRNDPELCRRIHDEWYALVISYIARQITKDTDLLPAISGLAAYFQHAIEDKYVAGLWSDDLLVGLLWSVDPWSAQKIQAMQTPSWSWACLRTKALTFWHCGPDTEIARYITIVEVQTMADSGNAFGNVSGGHIKLIGQPKRALAMAGLKKTEFGYSHLGSAGKFDAMMLHVRDDILLEKGEIAYIQDQDTGKQLGSFYADWAFESGSVHVWCVPMIRDSVGDSGEAIVALVVVRQGDGSWCRVGLARIKQLDWFEGVWETEMTLI